MRNWHLYALGLATFAIVVMVGKCAKAECLHSYKEVWAAHPGSHATWSGRLEGHKGEHCYFAAPGRKVATYTPPAVKGVRPRAVPSGLRTMFWVGIFGAAICDDYRDNGRGAANATIRARCSVSRGTLP